ncbi:glycosyltransferase family 4 protein [Pseudoalteromonas sp. MMG010]|uniref:glycosyltransferase family 4 protein n=1 Tax=Pseudoalteromonas sp. MMG010 TaxID=2822685 RepID=UPI001B3A6FBF|nr:glycosyltransferase family 4 protein [Pseudoalteromonas sp. MMG010]MBQ4834231.1 glycosyltransferase family 4 protein [Pseudoalteromonas sp. MMG010]
MKKIIHIQVVPQLSGVQQVSLDILKGLGPDFDKYILFGGRSEDDSFNKNFEEYGIKVIYVESLARNISLKDIKAFWDLYVFFKINDFDIVHTNSTKPGILARVAAKLAGIKQVYHTVHGIAFHQHEPRLKRFFYYSLEIISSLFGDLNITVNKYYLKYYPRLFCKSQAVYNGVDFSKLTVQKRNSSDCINIGFFARLDQQKDPLTFIHIVNHLLENKMLHHKVHFYLAGDGELREQCLDLIKRLNLNKTITYVGWVSNKSDFFNGIDILCQPSLWEAFGLNLAEAGYFSIPCVASNVEGIPEVVLHDKTGILCPAQNVKLFSEAIAKLVNDAEYRALLSAQAAKNVKVNFQQSTMVKHYKELYLNNE